jgi:hypothetical protein
VTKAADKQRRYRERNRLRLAEERAAKRERARQEEIRELNGTGRCGCCEEARPVFLRVTDAGVRCHNCAWAEAAFGLCPHQAISRRLG